MAAPSWRKLLNDHDIFENLREYSTSTSSISQAKNLLTLYNGDIFVWNTYRACILTTNLKYITDTSMQTLLCSTPPLFNVSKTLFNTSGSHLAVYGACGLSVIELPRRWGKYDNFEGGKTTITCRTLAVGEYFFASHSKVQLLKAAWHPGRDVMFQIVTLTSDYMIRIYDLNDPQDAFQCIPLSDNRISLNISSNSHFSKALGEQPVSFDFGPSLSVQHKTSKTNIEVWPLYVLWGNGNVYSLVVSQDERVKPNLVGPLSMLPPAEDNYGTDACSIMCLDTDPTILVIATSEGNVYHCILLRKEEPDNDSDISWYVTESSQQLAVPESTLYIYEKLELELSLTTITLDSDEPVIDSFTCPVHLLKENGTSCRYHCYHSAGVHSVALPWALNLEQFTGEMKINIASFNHSEQAIVEHLICTKPVSSSEITPVFGLCVVSDSMLGGALICLTSTCECTILPLVSTFKPRTPTLISTAGKHRPSNLRRIYREPFDLHIQKILQRTASNPLLKTSSKTELTPQECFQLMSRATQVFREEYIHKQDMAREELQRRVQILKEQKNQQLSDVQRGQQLKEQLSQKAENLAEKYDDVMYQQAALVQRVENVIRKIQKKVPIVSDAERSMYKELKTMDEQLKHQKNYLEQIKTKRNCQKRMIDQSQQVSSSPSVSNQQAARIKSLLKEEGDKICGLIKNVKLLQSQSDMTTPASIPSPSSF